MSALGRKVMDLAEQQGLLDVKAIAELRRQVAESKFVVTPEAIAKVLVDHGHLTPFQARKLVSQAMGNEPDRAGDGSTAEDCVPLKPAKVKPPPRGTRWKTDQPVSLSETIEMSPIDLGSSQPPPAP